MISWAPAAVRSFAAVCALLTIGAISERPRFDVDAMQRIVNVSNAVISPDGNRIAYLASRNVLERNTSVDALHVYDLRNGSDRTVPFAHESYSGLEWSGDGRLAFIADDAHTKVDQLYVTDAEISTERRLTSGTTEVLDAGWGHDGAQLAFLRRDPAPQRNGVAKYRDAFEVSDNAYLVKSPVQPAHLWTISLAGVERRITAGAWSVRDEPVTWSVGNASLLYERVPNAIYGIRDRSVVERANLDSGASTKLTVHAAYESDALYSPDGRKAAFLYPRDGVPQNEPEISVVPSQGGASRDISRRLDRHVEDYAWYDDAHLLARVYDRTRVRLFLISLDGGHAEIPVGEVRDASIDAKQSADRRGDVVFTGSTPSHPTELYYVPRGASSPQRLSRFNDAIAALQLGSQTEFSWKSGSVVEYGVLTYPPGYDRHRHYPLAVRIHGGPALSSLTAFDPFYQLAAARGYVVFAPNYRGSSNNGNAFEHAIFNDASIGPGTDVMSGIEAVIGTTSVDRNRIGISGWSYGGQLTTWMIAKYHIWKAAVTGAGVNDLVVDYAVADDIDDDRHAFSGPPYAGNAIKQWQSQSPITFVKQIDTPTLILSNVDDVRVPVVESYELYHALRDRDVPVRFYVYPTGGHLPSGPVRLADAYTKWLDWFDTYLRP